MAFLQLLDYAIRAIGLLFLIGVLIVAFRFSFLAGVFAFIFVTALVIVLAACRASGRISEEE
jgi:hypothetical protein